MNSFKICFILTIANSIKSADNYRLPQHSILRNSKKIQRPIIIKLNNSFYKQLVYKFLKSLTSFNNELNSKPRLPGYIYVTDHLSSEMLQQKRNVLHYSIKLDKKAKEFPGNS